MRPFFLLGLLLLSLPLWGQQQSLPTYLPPGTPQVDGMHHMVLIYHGQKVRPVWNKQALLPYVAYVNEQGEPQDWLFDGFLFLEFAANDGIYLHAYQKDKRLPTIADWTWLADAWFRPDSGLVGLEEAVAEVGEKLKAPNHKVPVVITLPLPLIQDKAFGPLPGQADTLDFSREENRQKALQWYIDRVTATFRERNYQHLTLAGFYWTPEAIPLQDRPLALWTSQYLAGLGLRHYWIPYHGGEGIPAWRELGFSGMMIQPNYFFDTPPPPLSRFQVTAKMARLVKSGVEIEFDARALTSDDFRKRFYAYLDAGVAYRWMDKALLGYYEGGGAVLQFAKDPRGRELYQKLYEFIKGTYKPSGLYDFSPLALISRDNSKNLALASRGGKIEGASKRPEWGDEIGPEKIIDGDIDFYGGMSGFGAFMIPGGFILDLPKVERVARTQTMFFDLDDRFFRYRIETSVDKVHWDPAVDKDTGEWRGWQVDKFTPRQAKYIRFTCLHNSVNQICPVVEFEVYSDPQD